MDKVAAWLDSLTTRNDCDWRISKQKSGPGIGSVIVTVTTGPAVVRQPDEPGPGPVSGALVVAGAAVVVGAGSVVVGAALVAGATVPVVAGAGGAVSGACVSGAAVVLTGGSVDAEGSSVEDEAHAAMNESTTTSAPRREARRGTTVMGPMVAAGDTQRVAGSREDRTVQAVYSPLHQRHDPSVEIEASALQAPFEHGGRIEAVRAALAGDPRFELVSPREFGTAPIKAVHDPGLVSFLASAWQDYQQVRPAREVVPDVFAMADLRRGMGPGTEPTAIGARLGWWAFETTTPLVEGTYTAACSAVDVALTAAEFVLSGERSAYGLCRPPGHHATSRLYGGYCFFNNAAIAAHHLVRATGSKVTVLDVDYHHGNGTQEIFWERGDVQYVSLHGDPVRAYPYHLGFSEEVGAGAGRGTTSNLPLPEGLDDDGYLAALDRACDAIERFGPSVLVVSLGLDTYVDDPICDLALTTEGMARCGALVAGLDLPTVVLQEGGYHVATLGANALAWLTPFSSRP
jgi:acetoin utilization deacetylase AcuC-like enzyme